MSTEQQKTVVIGIDPGIERTGFAIVEIDGHDMRAREYGCISTKSSMPIGERLVELRQDLSAIIAQHKPSAAVIERLVFVHNATSALAVGQARGVIVMTLQEHGLRVTEYSPSEVKMAATGNGSADKQQVGQAVRVVFGLREVPQPDDAADALALAVCHAGQVQYVQQTQS